MCPYRVDLATPADDADLRRVLAQTPMPGSIAVSFRREPSYFDAAAVDGSFRQVVAAYDTDTGRVVGFGSRSVGQRYVNGHPEPIGYLSSLRLLREHRNLGLVGRGYALFRRLHGDGRTPLYLTTIAEGNTPTLALLTSGRGGLPRYHFAGRYQTAALPLRRRSSKRAPAGLEVRPGCSADRDELVRFLNEEGRRRQFFPCYQASDFFSVGGVFRDLTAEEVLLAFRGGRLVGTLASWDQFAFRQTVVSGYHGALRWLRPLYNAWARVSGQPRLPPPGEALRVLTGALPIVAGEDRAVFAALLEALLARKANGPAAHLLLALHEADPLLEVLRSYPARWYAARLYLVCWDDGEALRTGLDGRPRTWNWGVCDSFCLPWPLKPRDCGPWVCLPRDRSPWACSVGPLNPNPLFQGGRDDPLMKLRGLLVPVVAVTARQRAGMFVLMERHFANVERARFDADLAEKQWVILLLNPHTGELSGFSTQGVFQVEVADRSVRALFSGDTIVAREHWGDTALSHVWGHLALSLIDEQPDAELYWFLISKGYKTYRFLPLFFRKYYPAVGQVMPARVREVLDALAWSKYPQHYDRVAGVIRSHPGKDRLRAGIAEVTAERLRDAHVRFFLERNPGHADGDELCCLAPLTRANFTAAAWRVIGSEPAVREVGG